MGFSTSHAGQTWSRLASGIEAGTVGGAAMLGMLISESLWSGHVWWEVPNLLGSTFYGARAFRSGAGLSTLSGAALHFVITGTLGGLFGLACGGIQQRGRLVLLGVLAGVGWYNLANAMFWPRVNPWVPIGSPRPATMFSHVLLGACLGYMGQRQKTPAAGSPTPHPEPPPTPAEPYPAEPYPIDHGQASLTGSCEPFPPPAEPHPSRSGEPSGTASEPPPAGSSEPLPAPAEPYPGRSGEPSAAASEPPPTRSTGPSLDGSGEPYPSESGAPSLAGSSGPAATPAPDALE